LAGFALETLTIDKNIIHKCIKEVAIKSNPVNPDPTKKRKSRYKNIYVLLCILCAIGGLFYTVSGLYDQPFISLKPSVQKSLSVRLNSSNLSSLSIKEKAVLPKPDQPGLTGEDQEDIYELYISGYYFDRQKNYKEAVRRYRKAAEQGHAQAQVNLGALYSKGLGVGQDYTEAVKWYRKAAEQEHAQAQNNLGVMYSEGQGVMQDFKEAARWYRKAAEQGVNYAKEALKRLEQDYPDVNDFVIDLQKPID
jgi:tetratricopeptide (TPR) repeat protein